MNDRQEYNRKIVDLLQKFVEKEPDLRFVQLLWTLQIISHEDNFYTESKETYNKILKILDEKFQ